LCLEIGRQDDEQQEPRGLERPFAPRQKAKACWNLAPAYIAHSRESGRSWILFPADATCCHELAHLARRSPEPEKARLWYERSRELMNARIDFHPQRLGPPKTPVPVSAYLVASCG
jgi:hypothetical protein